MATATGNRLGARPKCLFLRGNQVRQTYSRNEKNRHSLELLNQRPPCAIMAHLRNECWRFNPKTVILNLPDHSGIKTAGVHESEKDLLILQMRFIDHNGANYTPADVSTLPLEIAGNYLTSCYYVAPCCRQHGEIRGLTGLFRFGMRSADFGCPVVCQWPAARRTIRRPDERSASRIQTS
jgi:hypothetical protein